MTAQDFNKLLERRLCRIRETLEAKAAEYATGDRLHNFKADVGGMSLIEMPEEVLWGYLRKHLQSLYDMVSGFRPASQAAVDEKVGDAVVYLILLEALFTEQIQKKAK